MQRQYTNIEKTEYLKSKTVLWWSIIGCLIGYFVFHPCVMIISHYMFRSRLESGYNILYIIISETKLSFSLKMLPWSFSFALFGAVSGGFFGRIRQMTAKLQDSENKFKKLSITDDLTKLYNSRHFFNRLKDEIERTNRYGHPLSLLIMDLDNFKKYNDTYGHIEGDKVLANSGEILRKSLRKTDSAYRYGGEEFTIILPESSGQEAMHFAERIRQAFDTEGCRSKPESFMPVTVSVGVAQYARGEKISDFIKRADKNLYAAKNQGKNCIIFAQ